MIEKMRDPVSGLTHLGTAIAAVFGFAVLIDRGGRKMGSPLIRS